MSSEDKNLRAIRDGASAFERVGETRRTMAKLTGEPPPTLTPQANNALSRMKRAFNLFARDQVEAAAIRVEAPEIAKETKDIVDKVVEPERYAEHPQVQAGEKTVPEFQREVQRAIVIANRKAMVAGQKRLINNIDLAIGEAEGKMGGDQMTKHLLLKTQISHEKTRIEKWDFSAFKEDAPKENQAETVRMKI